MKHSYIIHKDFILCVLGEDEGYFYGEIMYGQKKLRGVKKIYFEGKEYYKYWQLENRNRGGNYNSYFETIKKLYPKNAFEHKLIGNIFRINKYEKYTIIPIKKIREMPRNIFTIGKKVADLLKVDISSLFISGSLLLNQKQEKLNDIDIIIYGLENIKRASKSLDEIVDKESFSLEWINLKSRRRFRYSHYIICPFGIFNRSNYFERYFIRKEKEKDIIAQVIDSSMSLLTPAVYKIRVNNEISLLISYYVGHVHLLKKGELIKFRAPLAFFKNKREFSAYVIPIQGSWIEILS